MKHLLSSITLLFLSTVAYGQVPNTFSSGETISSSKINANFAYLADGILKDNVTAMMVCQAEGFTESGVYYYASCYSSDDQTFEGTVSLKIKSTRIYPGSSIANFFESTTYANAISIKDLFSQKWVLYKYLQTQSTLGSSYIYIYPKIIFYKVSSN